MKRLIYFFLSLSFAAVTAMAAQDSTYNNLHVFLLDKNDLANNKNAIKSGGSNLSVQYKDLIRTADKILKEKPYSVTQKDQVPPGGDKHDYMSLGVYWWPNPDSKDGEPYIRKDGEKNPEAKDYNDHKYLQETNERIFKLALAYYFSENESYAIKAVELLRVWFLNPDTKMNPNLNFAQAIKGKNDGRGAGILDGKELVYTIEALGLIENSPAYTLKDKKEIQNWFESYRTWLLESKNGRDEHSAKNNHGTWYDVQMMSVSLYLGYSDFAKQYASRLKDLRIDYQIENDGKQPEELVRTTGLHYSYFNLEAVFIFTSMARNLGIDYSGYVSPDGRSIKKAIDFLYPFTTGEKDWEYKQIAPLNHTVPVAVLLYAYKYYKDKKYLYLALKLDGQNLKSRLELLYML